MRESLDRILALAWLVVAFGGASFPVSALVFVGPASVASRCCAISVTLLFLLTREEIPCAKTPQ